jgi:dihydrofolate reductase
VINVFAVAAITADGFIARDAGHGADWTSVEDKRNFVRLTKAAGVMVMGSTTFDTIGRALPGRRNIVYTSRPKNYQIEGVETTQEAPRDLIDRLGREGCEAVAIIGGAQIYDLFIKSGLVNELFLTVEPKLFGQGVNLIKSATDLELSLIEVEKLGDNTPLLRYRINQRTT